jgi:CRISPR/Cas system-associated exonuclease Cas4 (RecB family)
MNDQASCISVKTLADWHIEEFSRCPHQFYLKQLKKQQQYTWKQMVSYVVHLVIQDYFTLPPQGRTVTNVLRLLDTYWVKKVHLFQSKSHYYTVLASVANHLTSNLLKERESKPPVILFETLRTHSKQLQLDLSMTFHVVQWGAESLIIQKYLVDESLDKFTGYRHMALLFSEEAFERTPEKIELISLLSGKKDVWCPKEEDRIKSAAYMEEIKKRFKERSSYRQAVKSAECVSCSFQRQCEDKADQHVQTSIFVT